MSQSPSAAPWEAPQEPAGPAPGIAFAPHGERLIAYILDGIIVGVFVTIAALVAGLVLYSGYSGTPASPAITPAAWGGFAAIMLAVIVLATGYFPWFWARSGQTPGMKRFGLRVVDDRSGAPITGGQALLRLVGMWVSGAFFSLGYIWILIDSRRRGWHDLIAGTLVVKG